MAQVVEILPHGHQEPTWITLPISQLLMPGGGRSLVISSHGIYLILPEWSGINTSNVKVLGATHDILYTNDVIILAMDILEHQENISKMHKSLYFCQISNISIPNPIT